MIGLKQHLRQCDNVFGLTILLLFYTLNHNIIKYDSKNEIY